MPCNSGQNLAPICFAMCFPDVYEIRIPLGTDKKPLIPVPNSSKFHPLLRQ